MSAFEILPDMLSGSRRILRQDQKLFLIGSIFIFLLAVPASILFGLKALVLLFIPILLYSLMAYRYAVLYLYFCAIPFVIYLSGDVKVVLNSAMAVFVIGFWLIRKLVVSQEGIEISKSLVQYFSVFILIMLISALNGGVTVDEAKAIIRIIIFIGMVFVVYDLVHREILVKLFIAISIPMAVSAIYLIYQYSQVSSAIDFLALYRLKPAGIYSNANILGGTVVCVIALWYYQARLSENIIIKYCYWGLGGLLFSALILTNARAAIVGFVLAVLYLSYKHGKLKYVVMTGILVATVLYSSLAVRSILSTAVRLDRGGSSRVEIWHNSLDLFSKNIYFGVGLGNFREEYDKYMISAWERGFVKGTQHAHNILVSKAVDLGIMGILLILWLVVLSIKAVNRAIAVAKTNEMRMVVFGIAAGIISLWGRSLFEGSGILTEGSLYPDIIFWVLLSSLLKFELEGKKE